MKKMIFLTFCLWAGAVTAHTLPISYLVLVPDADYLHLELTLNPFELNASAGLERDEQILLNEDRSPGKPTGLAAQILDCLTIRVDGIKLQPEIAGLSIDPDSHHFTLRAHFCGDVRHGTIKIESRLSSLMGMAHFTQVTCVRPGREQLAQLSGPTAIASFDSAGRNSGLADREPSGRAIATIAGSSSAPQFLPLATLIVALPIAGLALAMLLTVILHKRQTTLVSLPS